ncbi:MAG: DUF4124 domain-containing protein [Pseudomonadales bacterium]
MPERTKIKLRCAISAFHLSVLLLFSTVAVAAEVYKWVDEQGNVHYTDKKPANDKEPAKVDVKVHNTRKDAELDAYREYTKRNREAAETEAAISEKKKAKNRQTQQKRQHACKKILKRKREYQQGGVIYSEKKSGDRKYYSDEERAEVLRKLNKALKKHC